MKPGPSLFHILYRSSVLLLAVMASSCSTVPTPIDPQSLLQDNLRDKLLIENSQPVFTEALSLPEAMARALKYNLDHRVKLLEQALASKQFAAGKFDMLPQLLVDAGYTSRDNDAGRASVDAITSISNERQHITSSVGFYWDLLDFGASYFNSQQNADRALIAVEQRRAAMNNLLMRVQSAFWQAFAAQRLEQRIQATIKEAEQALEQSRQVSKSKIVAPREALLYQRNLLENLRLLEGVHEELSLASAELSELIGAPAGSQYKLAAELDMSPTPLRVSLGKLEELVLMNNPRLRVEHYQVRIAQIETRKAFTRLLPNLNLSLGSYSDDDNYLINNTWQSASVAINYNLMDALRLSGNRDISELGTELAERRRMAMQLSVVTQLHIGVQQYSHAFQQYHRARDVFDVERDLSRIAAKRQASRVGGTLESISSSVSSILSEVRLFHAMAKVYEAESRVQATLGLEPKIPQLDNIALQGLSNLMLGHLEQRSKLFSGKTMETALSPVESNIAELVTPAAPEVPPLPLPEPEKTPAIASEPAPAPTTEPLPTEPNTDDQGATELQIDPKFATQLIEKVNITGEMETTAIDKANELAAITPSSLISETTSSETTASKKTATQTSDEVSVANRPPLTLAEHQELTFTETVTAAKAAQAVETPSTQPRDFWVQAGSYSNAQQAEQFASRLNLRLQATDVDLTAGVRYINQLYRVQFGPLPADEAQRLREKLALTVNQQVVVFKDVN